MNNTKRRMYAYPTTNEIQRIRSKINLTKSKISNAKNKSKHDSEFDLCFMLLLHWVMTGVVIFIFVAVDWALL